MIKVDFASIYQKNKLKMYSYVLYKVKSQSVAEDIVSDVFIKLFKELEKTPEIADYAVAWLYRVASNRVIDHFRSSHESKTYTESELLKTRDDDKDSSQETEIFVSEYKDVLTELAKEEQEKIVLQNLSKLKDDDREIIEYRLFQELPFKEISVILESTEAAVKMKYSRAIEKLKVICEKNE